MAAIIAPLKEFENLKIVMAGETSSNERVGMMLFAVLVHVPQGHGFDAFQVDRMFYVEAFWRCGPRGHDRLCRYRAMRAIDGYSIEVLISLALVFGTCAIALRLFVSGALAVVVAGYPVGNRRLRNQTQRYLFGF